MRKLGSLVLVALFALSLSAGVVSANPGASDPPSTSGGSQGKGATTDKYRASYINNSIGGTRNCVGVRVVNRNQTKDSFGCTFSNLGTLPVGSYTESNTSWLWRSDYDGKVSRNFSFVVSDKGDGTGSVQGVAYYS